MHDPEPRGAFIPALEPDDYGWSSAEAPQSCDYIAPAVLRILSPLRPQRILDLGCGNGALCSSLLNAGYDTVGVDFDRQGIETARANVPGAVFHRYGVQDDARGLLAEVEPFDVVVSTEVIEHLYSPHLLPQFAADVLNADGYLVVSTPYHGYLKNLAIALAGAWDHHHTALWHGGHIKFWSRQTLATLLMQNGFEIVDFHGVGRLPYLWKSMVMVARKIN